MISRTSPVTIAFGCAITLASAGCWQPMSPNRAVDRISAMGPGLSDQASALFYPLQVGNHWAYEQELRIELVLTGSPPMVSVSHVPIDLELIGTESRFGRTYVVEQQSLGGSVFFDQLLRQDKDGLYFALPQ